MSSLMIMATGGTGGHIYPAVATAQALLERGHRVALLGQRGGMEERVAGEQALGFYGVEAGKLARSGQGRADPRELWRAWRGVRQARGLLRELGPQAVVGFGGFASLPGVLAAQSLGLPTVLHEQNARLGLTQRLAVRRAAVVGTAYETVLGLDPRKARLVGMPIREQRLPRPEALAALGLRQGPVTLLIMGGSQGSLFMNEHLPGLLRNLFGPEGHTPWGEEVQVLHATGTRWLEQVRPAVAGLSWYHLSGYVDAVAAWSAADLGITRAGTGTLAEAAFHGVPLVMIPLPQSAENHQFHNGQSVERAGAGRVVEQNLFDSCAGVLSECLSPQQRAALQAAALKRAQPGAAARLADLVEGL